MNLDKIAKLFLSLLIFTNQTNIFAKTVDVLQERSLNPVLEWGPVKGATKYKIVLRCINLDGTTSVKYDKVLTTATSIKMSDILKATSVTPTKLTANALYRVKLKVKGTKADPIEYYFKAVEKYITVSPPDLLPDEETTEYNTSNNALTSLETTTTEDQFRAPLLLPNGVVITKLKVYYDDTGTAYKVRIKRSDKDDNISDQIITVTTDASNTDSNSESKTITTSGSEVINNSSFNYYVFVRDFETGNIFYRAEVYYECDKIES